MQLLESDETYLRDKGYNFEWFDSGTELYVIIHEVPLPNVYSVQSVDLLIKIPAGYPNAALDMFWTHPRVTLANGQVPKGGDSTWEYAGKTWQRWSRHRQNTPWRPGVDCLATHLLAIKNEITKGI